MTMVDEASVESSLKLAESERSTGSAPLAWRPRLVARRFELSA